MRILIVDDERMISEWMQYCIEKHPDCQVVGCAKNGFLRCSRIHRYGRPAVFSSE